MADEEKDQKVEEMNARIQALSATVEELSARLATNAPPPPSQEGGSSFDEEEVGTFSEFSEEVLHWAGKAALLQRSSALCFLLVVALVLRTLTDNNIIAALPGSAIGMGYAALLMLTGWWLYGRGNRLAPVFAACGAALMSVIVVETHSRFQSLPLIPAYLTLMATGIGMAAISYRFKVPAPISIGTLGICLAGAAIDYPEPFFPYLAMVLWSANILAFIASRIGNASWLRWIVFLVSMFMLHLWGVRFSHQQLDVLLMAKMGLSWFLPVLSIFAATFFVLSLKGILAPAERGPGGFDSTVPTISAVWSLSLALMTAQQLKVGEQLFGAAGMMFSLFHLGTGWWLSVKSPSLKNGANAFILAALAIMAAALPPATGLYIHSLPLISLASLALFPLSSRWENGGTRMISYLGQLYGAVAMVVTLSAGSLAGLTIETTIPASVVAVSAFCHYLLARRHSPPRESLFFGRLDKKDRSALLLFIPSLVVLFFILRICAYELLSGAPGDIRNSFGCAQSIIVNLMALFLMFAAFLKRNKEIRNIAIMATLIGGARVFVFDLLGSHGMPLVTSVFVFGLVAALESIALGRWHHGKTG